MDQKLLAWGLRGKPTRLPRLWLFTDEQRLPDPRRSVACLPRGKAGVVLRHDHDPDRAQLGADLARLCRMRRLVLVVAGDVRLAAELRAGVHLRGGRWPGSLRHGGVVTSSAHSIPEARRAKAAGACLVFLSPAFPTASHAATPALGPLRWTTMASAANARPAMALPRRCVRQTQRAGAGIAALGGIDGRSVIRLPAGLFEAVGAIGALATR